MAEKETKTETQALVRVKDIETRQLVTAQLQAEFDKLAKDLGVDLRMGHLMAMGGKPYLTHEGVKAMMHGPNGPGIKKLSYEFRVDSWENQQFIVTCHLVTKDGQEFDGDGDAIGVPLDEMKRISDEARKTSKKAEDVRDIIKREVTAYPLKNVSSMIAMGFSARRMAQTRAFNRAARFSLKVGFTTIEETTMEETSYESTAVLMPTDAQRDKIDELLKSSKAELQDVVLRYAEAHGKPNTWSEEVAGQFIEDAIKSVEEHRQKALPAKDEPKDPVIAGQAIFRQGDKK